MTIKKHRNGGYYAHIMGSPNPVNLHTRDAAEAMNLAKAAKLEEVEFAAKANLLTAETAQRLMVSGKKATGALVHSQWLEHCARQQANRTAIEYSGHIERFLKRNGMESRNIANVTAKSVDAPGTVSLDEADAETGLTLGETLQGPESDDPCLRSEFASLRSTLLGMVGELKDGKVSEYEIHPEDFGLQMSSNRSLRVENSAESKEMIYATLANPPGTAREIVVLNAGTALYVANVVESIQQGITLARDAIASGAARAKLDEFVRFTQGFSA